MGGLGNQLFLIFTLISLSLDKQIAFMIPFNKSDLISLYDNTSLRPTYWYSIFKHIKYLTILFEEPSIRVNEINYTYNSFKNIEFDKNKNYKLIGYYQSYKYFENNFTNIKKFLKLDEQINVIKKDYFYYFNLPIISLHFRIGDYKNIQDYHPILDIDYYISAIKYIYNKTNINKILYFNEIKDEKEVINKLYKLKEKLPELDFFECKKIHQDWEQLLIMSCCNHNIIANSNFSWWAAYLNTNPDKIVCYPTTWFGKCVKNDTKDLFPENWIKI